MSSKKTTKKKNKGSKNLFAKFGRNPKLLLFAVFIIFFALIGAYYLTRSKAETGSGGKGHFCWVIQTDHSVKCWGRNWEGQIGNGEDRNTCIEKYNNKTYTEEQYRLCAFPSSPTKALIDNVRSVTAGFKNTCAIKLDNTLWCWGQNSYGQVDPTNPDVDVNTPKQVAGLTNVRSVTFPKPGANGIATCALKNDGTVWCWGSNGGGVWAGYLGIDKTIGIVTAPTQVPNIDNVTALSAGGAHICALKNDGTVWCWGNNYSGQLGIGTTGNIITVPTKSGMSNATKISAGFDFTCAVKTDSTLWCWGSNGSGQLGVKIPRVNKKNTSGFVGTPSPMQISGISNVKDISSGTAYNCATKNDLSLWCWGDNISGQLGRGTRWQKDPQTGYLVPNPDEYIPQAVTGFTNTAQVATTFRSTCAAQTNGSLYCWGWDVYRQLGQGGVFDEIYIEIIPAQTNHDKLVPTIVPNINVN